MIFWKYLRAHRKTLINIGLISGSASALVLFGPGCKTSPKPAPAALVSPASPWGPSGPPASALAVSRALPAFVAPPPVAVVLAWDAGTNTGDFWIDVATNAIAPGNWWTLLTVPNTGAASYSVTAGATVAFWRLNQLPNGVHFP